MKAGSPKLQSMIMPRRKKKNRLVSTIAILTIAILIVVIRLYDEIGVDKIPSDRFQIVRVLDGDTVELRGGDRLRLLAVDTPEKNDPYYKEAKEFLEKLVLNQQAKIEYSNKRRDRYGRLLGYLYIDTLFINKVIVANGLGYLYLFKDNDLSSNEVQSMLVAQKNAIDRKINLWSVEHTPEKFYLSSPHSFRFHRPSCGSINENNYEKYVKYTDRTEALLKGLSPCRNCKP